MSPCRCSSRSRSARRFCRRAARRWSIPPKPFAASDERSAARDADAHRVHRSAGRLRRGVLADRGTVAAGGATHIIPGMSTRSVLLTLGAVAAFVAAPLAQKNTVKADPKASGANVRLDALKQEAVADVESRKVFSQQMV